MLLIPIVIVVSAYIIGSIPTGVLVARVFGAGDPRSAGSGNIGATNVARTVGKKAGLITLAGDILKGALPTYIAAAFSLNPWTIGLTGLFVLLGHLFPLFLGFKGGKGVATAGGVIGAISLPVLLICSVVFLAGALSTRYVSAGSILSALIAPIAFSFILKEPAYAIMGMVISALVIYRHKENIQRLRQGKENRFF
ncbi:MAG: glycerol-3-phosphate 1-O-acyltransferase PlsY [Deltaproteobacteria bacterium]|nr:glycerol-3-phosphate 1-O-acyltransferase PlsY [Deltaproteobacteria bacterium]